MVRLHVFAEGQTEQTYADTVLKPHLALHDVQMSKPILIAHAKKKGRVHRGGGRNYLPMKNDIKRFFKQHRKPDVFVTTMIDLYAIHSDFPGLEDAKKLRHSPEERVKCLECHFAADIDNPRFIPYIQLHEFEALLFTDPRSFAYYYDACQRQIASLEDIAAKYSTPEMINDGQHSAPSKQIIKQFPEYERSKAVDGPQLAESIGLSNIRAQCKHFDAWVSRLEMLGENASEERGNT